MNDWRPQLHITRTGSTLALLLLLLIACVPRPHPARRLLPAYLDQAEALIAERQYGQALDTLEEAAQVYPETPQPLLTIGRIYLLQQRWLPAEDAFNRALARDPTNPVALAGLAETRLNQGKLLQSLELWQQAAELAEFNEFSELGEFGEFISPIQNLKSKIQNPFTGLGRAYLLRFEFEAAREAFLAQQAHHSDPEALWHLAALAAPEDVEAANEYLLAIPPGAPEELLARRDYLLATLVPFTAASPQAEVAQAVGIAFVQVGHWPLAAHALTIASELPGQPDEEQAETLAFLAHALAQAGRPAFELFEQATSLDPGSALPAYFYGIYLRRQGALQAAQDQFTKALALDPENAAIYVELAQTFLDQGSLAAAERLYTAAAELAEDNSNIQLLRINFYANRGYRIAEAGIPAAEALLEEDEDNAEAYDLLGWMHFLTGNQDEAEQALRQALELDPDLISARYHLARSLAAAGRVPEAIAEYQKVIDWDASNLYRPSAVRELQRLRETLQVTGDRG